MEKQKTQKKGVNPEKVKTLIRKISQKEYAPKVRELGWKRLMEWNETSNCRLAIEAILSCAQKEDSPFYEKAHQWLTRNINLPLVQAVIVYEASRNDETRKNILYEIVDRHGLLSSIFQELWQYIKTLPIDWESISKEFAIHNYLPNPMSRQIDYWEACRWVMENSIPENIVSIVHDLLNEWTAIDQSPELQKTIVAALLQRNTYESKSLLKERLTILWQGVIKILALGDLEEKFSPITDSTFLIETIIARFNDLNEERINDLVKINNINVWSLGYLIAPKAPTSDQTSKFIADWMMSCPELTPEYLKPIIKSKSFHSNKILEEKEKIINCLPLEKVAGYLAEIGDLSRFVENPNLCRQFFGDKVKYGKASLSKVVQYLDIVGRSKLSGIELNGWLRKNKEDLSDYQKNQQELEKLIRKFVIPWNLSLGGLLMNAEVVNFICRIGHHLSDDDAQNLASVISLKSHFREIEEIPAWNFWKNEHWRKTILSMVTDFRSEQRNLITVSLILTLDKEELVLIFTENPELIEVLPIIACGEKYSSAIREAALVFIELLLEQKKDPFTSEKIDFIHNELVLQDFLLQDLIQKHPKILENLFNQEELAKIFFKYLQNCGDLPDQKEFVPWVEKIGATSRMIKWLIQNKKKYHADDWLDWAIYFKDNLGIRHAARKFLESEKEKIAMKALEFFKD